MAHHTVPANGLAIKALRCPEGKGRRPPVALTKVILDRDSLLRRLGASRGPPTGYSRPSFDRRLCFQ